MDYLRRMLGKSCLISDETSSTTGLPAGQLKVAEKTLIQGKYGQGSKATKRKTAQKKRAKLRKQLETSSAYDQRELPSIDPQTLPNSTSISVPKPSRLTFIEEDLAKKLKALTLQNEKSSPEMDSGQTDSNGSRPMKIKKAALQVTTGPIVLSTRDGNPVPFQQLNPDRGPHRNIKFSDPVTDPKALDHINRHLELLKLEQEHEIKAQLNTCFIPYFLFVPSSSGSFRTRDFYSLIRINFELQLIQMNFL